MEQDKIVIEHLNLWYGSFQALKDINLRLPANEITAFIGPSGCGKSTLLKSLNRMNDLVEGCRIEGYIVFRAPIYSIFCFFRNICTMGAIFIRNIF